MVVGLFVLGVFPAVAPGEAQAPAPVAVQDELPASEPATAPPVARPDPPVPWGVLTNRRLLVTTKAGTSTEGLFLGVENGYAIVEADDGTLASIATDDVASVRTVAAPVPPIPTPADAMTLAFREDDARIERQTTKRRAQGARAAAIVGGVIASFSGASSIIAEAFNIRRWSLSSFQCGQSYYGTGEICGWTDGIDTHFDAVNSYDYYENMAGIVGASTIAVPLHVVAGPTILVPSTRLRQRIGYRGHRGRQIASWVLWGAGLGSLTANQAVAWTQIVNATEICDPRSLDGLDCVYITPTRGAPPSLYLMSAGLTLASAILGIIEANDVARQAETSVLTPSTKSAKRRASPTASLFPFRLQRGGGLGVAGRF